MNKLRFFKVAALGDNLLPDSVYFIQPGSKGITRGYITDSTGVPYPLSNFELIDQRIALAMQDVKPSIDIVGTYNELDGQKYKGQNTTVFVKDASLDETVNSGGAYYFFEANTGAFIKLAEFESLDLNFSWYDLKDRPQVEASDIEKLVSSSHSHANMSTLDQLSDDGDCIAFKGSPVVRWERSDW